MLITLAFLISFTFATYGGLTDETERNLLMLELEKDMEQMAHLFKNFHPYDEHVEKF